MLNFAVFTFTLIITSTSYADFTKACFSSSKMAQKAKTDISFLNTGQDSITRKSECLKINATESRINLYQKYLKKNYQVSFVDIIPDNSSTRSNCNVNIRKEILTKSDSSELIIDANKPEASNSNKKQIINSISQMVLTEGLEGEIAYGEESYKITCFKKRDGHEIRVTSTGGEVNLVTSRFIKSGEEIELGSIVSNKKNDEKEISTHSGLKTKQNLTQNKSKVFISIR